MIPKTFKNQCKIWNQHLENRVNAEDLEVNTFWHKIPKFGHLGWKFSITNENFGFGWFRVVLAPS